MLETSAFESLYSGQFTFINPVDRTKLSCYTPHRRGKFGQQVLTVKLQCCQGQLAWFPMVTISAAVHRLQWKPNFEKGQTTSASTTSMLFHVLHCLWNTGNGASCLWQQHDFKVKTWWANLVAPYSTDNHSVWGRGIQRFTVYVYGLRTFLQCNAVGSVVCISDRIGAKINFKWLIICLLLDLTLEVLRKSETLENSETCKLCG